MPKVKELDAARAAGLPTYSTGKQCAKGHISSRYTSTRTCVQCADIKAKRWHAENQTARRISENNSRRRRLFGLDVTAYEAMKNSQGGGCAICGGLNATGRALAVDHDHSCCPGEKSCGACVRGLLCDNCNHALGKLKDRVELLRKAISYLERFT